MSSIREDQTSKRRLFGSPRTLLAAVCLVLILISSGFAMAPVLKNPGSPNLHSESLRSKRAQLRCFANAVHGATRPGDSILLELPRGHSEGGLVTERLRYVLPGRHLFTRSQWPDIPMSGVLGGAPHGLRREFDYLAVWDGEPRGGPAILRRCGGVLRRSKDR